MEQKNQVTTYKDFVEYVTKLGKGDCFGGDKGIDSLLNKVSSVTAQSIDNIIICSDFKGQELSIEKLESIISELRAVVFLHNNNFLNIKLLKRFKNKPRVDIYAEKLDKNFNIEVTCLTAEHSREKNGLYYILDDDKFLREFTSRIKSKISQLNNGVNNKKMLIFVMNRYPEKALTDEKKYREFFKKAYDQSELNNNYYLGLVTGNVDFIYHNT